MPVEIVVKLTPGVAVPESSGYRNVQQCAARNGIALQPLHPSTFDPELSLYFTTTVEADQSAKVLESLRKCDSVDGAYEKPAGEAP